jgi:hypothetical protein
VVGAPAYDPARTPAVRCNNRNYVGFCASGVNIRSRKIAATFEPGPLRPSHLCPWRGASPAAFFWGWQGGIDTAEGRQFSTLRQPRLSPPIEDMLNVLGVTRVITNPAAAWHPGVWWQWLGVASSCRRAASPGASWSAVQTLSTARPVSPNSGCARTSATLGFRVRKSRHRVNGQVARMSVEGATNWAASATPPAALSCSHRRGRVSDGGHGTLRRLRHISSSAGSIHIGTVEIV